MAKRILTFVTLWFVTIVSGQQLGKVSISEVYFDSAYSEKEEWGYGEFIEFFNSSTSDIDISGWKVYDQEGSFTFPQGTIIRAGNFIVVAFGLSSDQSKFLANFPEAVGHEQDLIFQTSIQLNNKHDLVMLKNLNNETQDIMIFCNWYIDLNGANCNASVTNIDNSGMTVTNEPIPNSLRGGLEKGDVDGFYQGEDGSRIQYDTVNVSPFSISYTVPLKPLEDTGGGDDPVVAAGNWIHSNVYNLSGIKIGASRTYFDDLGNGRQSLSYDIKTQKIWASETFYDYHGRTVLQTLSAPVEGTGFALRDDFIKDDTGSLFSKSDYDNGSFIDNPRPLSTDPTVSKLGFYYSESNQDEPYQDVTDRPYTRTLYSRLNPGTPLKVIGGNKVTVNGQDVWPQSYSFTMQIGQELTRGNAFSSTSYQAPTKRIIKTVNRDVHGIETVVFTEEGGNVLAAARSGNEHGDNTSSYDNTVKIGDQGFVDIHIPQGCSSSVSLLTPQEDGHSNGGTASQPTGYFYRVYNLMSETQVMQHIAGNITLNPGLYRIETRFGRYLNAIGGGRIYFSSIVRDEDLQMGVTHCQNYYDYSLNYYDKADRLIRSTQPNSKTMASEYEYNSLGQLLKAKSPDEGEAKFKYRRDGQIRFSQNELQKSNGDFSYTNYDNLGRPIESGLVRYFASVLGIPPSSLPPPNTEYGFDNLDPDEPIGIGRGPSGPFGYNFYPYFYEQHLTEYDAPDQGLEAILVANSLPVAQYKQKFLSGNVSKTYTQNPTTATTWYSYDVYGRVRFVVQQIEGFGVKTIDYEYDPISGLVTHVDYQRHGDDRFIHQYTYNDAYELIEVATAGPDKVYETQAKYYYNENGSLKRKEIGGNLQGVDYVYNINGQLKAINSPTLNPSDDPGQDGTSAFSVFPADLFGMAIDYNDDDYTRSNTPTPVTHSSMGTDQLNGNIKALRWNTTQSTTPSAYVYGYDKNNWLKSAQFGAANASGVVTPSGNNDFKVDNLSYDANGNILTLTRNGFTDANGNNSMDDFTYNYKDGTNQLDHVVDAGDNTDPNRYNDLRDQASGNYVYNALGQLTFDQQEAVSYEYNAAGLVTKINGLSSTDTQAYTTIYSNDFGRFSTTEVDAWAVDQGTVSYAFPCIPGQTICQTGDEENQCIAIEDTYGWRLKFNVTGTPNTASRNLNVIKDVYHELSLDFIADQLATVSGSVTIGATIEVLHPTTHAVLASQTISSRPNEHCDRYYDERVSLGFTAPAEDVVLRITGQSSNSQFIIMIDNLLLEAATTPKLAFTYNDRGHRVTKQVFGKNGTATTTYVRDVSGTPLAIYEQNLFSRDIPVENPVYGDQRLGVAKRSNYTFTNVKPQYVYQLTDHLGNVRAVFAPTGLGGGFNTNISAVSLVAKTDYYPFGMPMPNRNIEGDYRYTYQGQEKDPETGKEAFELRLWDARIGRWLSPDPAGQFFSPYLGMSNNPISFIDPDGGFAECPDCPDGTYANGTEWIGSDGGTYVYDEIGGWSDGAEVIGVLTINHTKTQGLALASAIAIRGGTVSATAAAADGPFPIGDGAGAVNGVLAGTTALAMATYYGMQSDIDDLTVISSTQLPFITLHRGVSANADPSIMYFEALNGIAIPNGLRNGFDFDNAHGSSERHALGDNYSVFTSWTSRRSFAHRFATDKFTVNGIVLTKNFRLHSVFFNFSDAAFNLDEGEYLVPGPVSGAIPTFVTPNSGF